ncbi:MAG TPA: hypothetical protein VHM88_05950 [Candidatus Acidoferrales bacterium]|nr:hypothetical protein [Candidatus Acidoferrales bacterium]
MRNLFHRFGFTSALLILFAFPVWPQNKEKETEFFEGQEVARAGCW